MSLHLENTEIVNLTPSAIKAVRDLLAKRQLTNFALRIFVSGGSCSGFQYGMALEDKIRPEDQIAEIDGIKVVIDEISIEYLMGSTVDYIEDVMGSGFKIYNPNSVSSCGCGNSFRTKNDAGQNSGCNCG